MSLRQYNTAPSHYLLNACGCGSHNTSNQCNAAKCKIVQVTDVFFTWRQLMELYLYLPPLKFAIETNYKEMQDFVRYIGSGDLSPKDIEHVIVGRHIAATASLNRLVTIPWYPRFGRRFVELANGKLELDMVTQWFLQNHEVGGRMETFSLWLKRVAEKYARVHEPLNILMGAIIDVKTAIEERLVKGFPQLFEKTEQVLTMFSGRLGSVDLRDIRLKQL